MRTAGHTEVYGPPFFASGCQETRMGSKPGMARRFFIGM